MISLAYKKILRRQLPLILLIFGLLALIWAILTREGENLFTAKSMPITIVFVLLPGAGIVATLCSLRPVRAFARELAALSPALRERVEADFPQCEQIGGFYFTRDFLVLHNYRGGALIDLACIPYGEIDSIDAGQDGMGVQEITLRAQGTVRRVPHTLHLDGEEIATLKALLAQAKAGQVAGNGRSLPGDGNDSLERRRAEKRRTWQGIKRSPLFSILYSFVILFLYPLGMLGTMGLESELSGRSTTTAYAASLFWPHFLFLALTVVLVGANVWGFISFFRKIERPPTILELMTLFFYIITTGFILLIAFAYGGDQNILGQMATGFSLLF